MRVDLAHVPPPVILVHVVDVQSPDLLVMVGEGDSLVPRDDVVVNRHDGLGVNPDPGDLNDGNKGMNNS